MKKRFLSMLLVLSMVLSMLPTISLPAAAEEEDKATAETEAPWSGAIGDGTADSPWEISSGRQLQALAEAVNNGGKSYLGNYFQLTADLHLYDEGICGKITVDWIEKTVNWTPIGTKETPFQGTFSGYHESVEGRQYNDYVIYQMFIDSTADYQGLFGYVGEYGHITNVSVQGNGNNSIDISGGTYVGGVAGYNAGRIEKSYASLVISGEKYVGGIVGYNAGEITRCAARSDYTLTGETYVGGIAGYNVDAITSCTNDIPIGADNSGKVVSQKYVGGIVGYNGPAAVDAASPAAAVIPTVTNCHNNGKVKAVDSVGGIAGASEGGVIQKCYGTGSSVVSATRNDGSPDDPLYAGGIVGQAVGNNRIEICWNAGSIVGTGGSCVGGILGGTVGGTVSGTGTVIENCYNVGEVGGTSVSVVGGIAGRLENGAIRGCYNYGVTSASTSGTKAQIVDHFQNTAVTNCCYSVDGENRAAGVGATEGQIGTTETLVGVTNRQRSYGEVAWLLEHNRPSTQAESESGTKNPVWGQLRTGPEENRDQHPQLIGLPRNESTNTLDSGRVIPAVLRVTFETVWANKGQNPDPNNPTAIYRYTSAGGTITKDRIPNIEDQRTDTTEERRLLNELIEKYPEGYELLWRKTPDNSTEPSFDENTEVTEDMVLYAVLRVGFAGKYDGDTEINTTVKTTYGQGYTLDLNTLIEYAHEDEAPSEDAPVIRLTAANEGPTVNGHFRYDLKKINGVDVETTSENFVISDAGVLTVTGKTDAGEYTLTIEATEDSEVIKEPTPIKPMALSPDYGTEPVTLTVTVQIDPKEIPPKITYTSLSKEYDGTTDVTTAQGLGIGLEGLENNDAVTATASYAYNSANVSEAHQITASGIELVESEKSGNYTLAATTATLTGASITQRPAVLAWENLTGRVYGDSKVVTADITNRAAGDSAEDVYIQVTGGDQTQAGQNYTATASLRGQKAGNYTLTDNTRTYSIEPRTLDFQLNQDISSVYDGTSNRENIADLLRKRLVETEGLTEADYTFDVFVKDHEEQGTVDPINVGNYLVRVYGQNNYQGTLEALHAITPAEPTADMFKYTAPQNLTYDSTPKIATVELDTAKYSDPEGLYIVEYYKDGEPLGDGVLPTDAGAYTVKVVVYGGTNLSSTNQDEPLESSAWKFTIAKADPTAGMFTVVTPVTQVVGETIPTPSTTASPKRPRRPLRATTATGATPSPWNITIRTALC